jgi:hypothetical protein
MFTNKNFKPQFFTEAQKGLELHGDKLIDLIGKEITGSWILWDNDQNEWFSDAPVVIEIEHAIQLELLANKTEEFSITFDAIDLSEEPTWFGDDSWNFCWKRDGKIELAQIVNCVIQEIRLVDHCPAYTIISDKNTPENVGKTSKWSWMMNAFEIICDHGEISIFNALDENGISDKLSAGKEYRWIKVAGN